MSPKTTQALSRGGWAEDLALTYLARRGLCALDRNYRCRGGELDLICLHHDRLVFVEVRFRRQNALVSAVQSITFAKQQRLRLAAAHYLASHRDHARRPCRFDVVTVTGSGQSPDIRWIRNAFQDG